MHGRADYRNEVGRSVHCGPGIGKGLVQEPSLVWAVPGRSRGPKKRKKTVSLRHRTHTKLLSAVTVQCTLSHLVLMKRILFEGRLGGAVS